MPVNYLRTSTDFETPNLITNLITIRRHREGNQRTAKSEWKDPWNSNLLTKFTKYPRGIVSRHHSGIGLAGMNENRGEGGGSFFNKDTAS